MKIPYRRIRTDVAHLYVYGSVEIGVAFLVVLLFFSLSWPGLPSGMMTACVGGRGFQRILQGIRRQEALRNLGVTEVKTISLEAVREIVAASGIENGVMVGYGFFWGQEHAQAYLELASLPQKEKYFTLVSPLGGLPYIHNVGRYLDPKAEKPIVLKLPEHTAFQGTTGVGKTANFELVAAQRIAQHRPVIVMDPKSDSGLLDAVYSACVQSGREKSFYFISLAHPQVSTSMNCLENFSTPGEIAYRITMLMPQKGNSKPFVDFCFDVISAVVEALIVLNEPVTLKNIYEFSVLSRPALLDQASSYRQEKRLPLEDRTQLDKIIRELNNKINHDKTHYQKMTTSLIPVLKTLTYGNIGNILSPDRAALTWEKIIREDLVVFISLGSMKDNFTASNVGKLIRQDLVYYLGDLYTRQRKFKEIDLFEDELATMFFEGDVDILNKLRAAGLRTYVNLQTPADIEALSSAPVQRQVDALLTNKFFLRLPDGKQAEEITKTLGRCYVPKATLTRNVAGSMTGHDLTEGELYRSGYSQRMDLTETDLVAPEILTSLPTGQAIVTSQGFPPIKIKTPLLEKNGGISFFERLETLYGSPPKPDSTEREDAPTETFDWLHALYGEEAEENAASEDLPAT